MNALRTALKQVSPTPPLSPEREVLAAAIKELTDFDAEDAALLPAFRKLDDQIAEARNVHEAARGKLAGAQEATAKHLADTAMGRPHTAPPSLKEMRAAAMEAEDNFVTLKRARTSLEERRAALTATRRSALRQDGVKDAAAMVIKSEVDAETLCADIRKLQDQLIAKRLVLCFLRELRAGIGDIELNKDWMLPTTDCQFLHLLPPQWRNNPAPDWRSAFNDLCRDATAAVPEL